jgi:hypothetical protein
MIICEKCKSENPERNYYCRWCGEVIKERVEDGAVRKPLNDRFNYLLDLEIIDEKSEDKDVYAPYRCKVKK